MPISIYNSVQTGPNNQLGGEKKGLLSVTYQVGMAEKVKMLPRIPTASQNIMEKRNLGRDFIEDYYEAVYVLEQI